ncbi:MAG TPA: hypothetical protein VIV40_15375 [Kofleriaceae bacterium]
MVSVEDNTMLANSSTPYARCINASKKVRWDIDIDVIRGRTLDTTRDFLPKALSLVDELPFLTDRERRLMSQVQGRTYANLFGVIERYINAKILDLSRDYWFGDQVALEALVRFSDEELKHQELFRRVEQLAGAVMPSGYRCVADGNAIASVVLGKSTWAVLALTCHIEIFTLVHYKKSIAAEQLADLWKDVFLYHWKEESQHAQLDVLEWKRIDASITPAERDRGVDELIELVGAVDGVLQAQAQADAEYFSSLGDFTAAQQQAIRDNIVKAYRWQYIVSGVQEGSFVGHLQSMLTAEQIGRITNALAPLM